MDLAVELGIALGLLFWGWVIWEGLRSYVQKPDLGTTFAVDQPALGGMRQLTSERWGITGRPDELRRLKDGTIIPVEIKSSPAPRGGAPYPSHRLQLLAYCALVEESFGRTPPYGVLVYGDGSELRVSWDARAKADLKSAVARWTQPYMGEADPSPGKCWGCGFTAVCNVSRTLT